MTLTAATLDASRLVVRTTRTEPQAQRRTSPPSLRRALSRGFADLVGLIGAIYLFPITVLAIGIPIALAINGLIAAVSWAWRALG